MRKSPDIIHRERSETRIEWKGWTVGVMGASSDKNAESMSNGYEVGKLLAEMGYDVANGGYAVGGMGETARGFQETCATEGANMEACSNGKSKSAGEWCCDLYRIGCFR